MSIGRYEIREARRGEAQAALELVLAETAPALRAHLAAELQLQLPTEGDRAAGLYVAADQGVIRAAAWGQAHQGNTASVWRPRFQDADETSIGAELTRRTAEWLTLREPRLIQSLVSPHDALAAHWLTACGFARIARLGYLVWEADDEIAAGGSLRWECAADGDRRQLARVVEQSYAGALDCPALNGVRTVNEVLGGYREVGEYWPDAWLLAWEHDRPAGCLILADHPAGRQCELVYMGLVPESRGRGRGAELITRAKRLVRERGRDRLVLAVDLRNAPALKHYHRHGFELWDERDVFARTLIAKPDTATAG